MKEEIKNILNCYDCCDDQDDFNHLVEDLCELLEEKPRETKVLWNKKIEELHQAVKDERAKLVDEVLEILEQSMTYKLTAQEAIDKIKALK